MKPSQLKQMVRAGNTIAAQALNKYQRACRPAGKAVKKRTRSAQKGISHLEHVFARQIESVGLPVPEWGGGCNGELKFHPTRKWRFDFAWPERMIAVEIEGGTYIHGKKTASVDGEEIRKSRHLTAGGFHEDCIKYAEAAILGWYVLRVDAKMVNDGSALSLLERALNNNAGQN